MKLKLSDRYALLGVLPEKNDFVTMKIFKKLREDLFPNEKEIKAYGIKALPNDRIAWDKEADKGKEIEIGEIAKEEIKKKLKELNEKKELREDQLSLYELFVENNVKEK